METQKDELRDGGAGGTDDGAREISALHQLFRAVGDQLRRYPYLEHLVEAQREQTLDDVVGVVEVIELPEQRGRRERDPVPVAGYEIEAVVNGALGAALAAAHAFAAVDALVV